MEITAGDWCPTITTPSNPCTAGQEQFQCDKLDESPTGSVEILSYGTLATYQFKISTAGNISFKFQCKYGTSCANGVLSGTTAAITATIIDCFSTNILMADSPISATSTLAYSASPGFIDLTTTYLNIFKVTDEANCGPITNCLLM